MTCTYCGTRLEEESRYCIRCGAPQQNSYPQPQQPDIYQAVQQPQGYPQPQQQYPTANTTTAKQKKTMPKPAMLVVLLLLVGAAGYYFLVGGGGGGNVDYAISDFSGEEQEAARRAAQFASYAAQENYSKLEGHFEEFVMDFGYVKSEVASFVEDFTDETGSAPKLERVTDVRVDNAGFAFVEFIYEGEEEYDSHLVKMREIDGTWYVYELYF